MKGQTEKTKTVLGVTFYMYDTYTSNADGLVFVEGLPFDDYFFNESLPPKGYQLNTDENGEVVIYRFSVNSENVGEIINLGLITNSMPSSDDGYDFGRGIAITCVFIFILLVVAVVVTVVYCFDNH